MRPRLAASAAALVLAAGAVVFLAGQGCNRVAGKVSKDALKSDKEKVSYLYGYQIGASFRSAGVQDEIDPDLLARGARAGMAGEKPIFTEAESSEVMQKFMTTARTKHEEKQKAEAEKNKAEGEKFLAENKAKEGVKTTASGLQYKVLNPGSGPSPKPKDTITVHYRGTLIDGTEFDSSYGKQPATFQLGMGLVKAWQEALPMMKTGAKWQLFVPPSLGYEDRGTPDGKIGPNAVLVFEVELLSIGAPPASAGMPPIKGQPKQ